MTTFTVDKEQLLKAADNMAAAATDFKGHGYDLFINAREEFKRILSELDNQKIRQQFIKDFSQL